MGSRAAAVLQLLCVLVMALQVHAVSTKGDIGNSDDNMMCFYLSVMENEQASMYYAPSLFDMFKDKQYQFIKITCPSPSHVCYHADGRYGNYSALSSTGCMAKDQCNRVGSVRFKGVVYSQHFSCCDDYNFCNAGPCLMAKSFPLIMTLVVALGQMLSSW